jgi:hypothetical protein
MQFALSYRIWSNDSSSSDQDTNKDIQKKASQRLAFFDAVYWF